MDKQAGCLKTLLLSFVPVAAREYGFWYQTNTMPHNITGHKPWMPQHRVLLESWPSFRSLQCRGDEWPMTWRFNKLCFRNNTKEHWMQWHGGAKEMAILGCKPCCPKLRNCRDVVGYSISQQVLSLRAKCGILSSKCLEFEKMMSADELGMQLVNAPTAPPVPRRQLWEGTASWVGWHVVSRISTLNHVQPLNILPFCIMLHHCTTPIKGPIQRVSPESWWIRAICTARLTDFFVTASSQRSTWKTGSHSLQASIGGQRFKLRKRNCWLWSCRKQEQSCKASKGFRDECKWRFSGVQ